MAPASATTDADGRARTQWTLGDDPGVQALFVTVDNVDSTVVVEAEAEPVVRKTRVAAIAPTLRDSAGLAVRDSVGVRITDSIGRAITWAAPSGRRTGATPNSSSSFRRSSPASA